jgi:hypothetical protein
MTITARTGKGDEAEVATKTITVTVTDLDDEAPTNIQINNAITDINGFVTLANDKGDDRVDVIFSGFKVKGFNGKHLLITVRSNKEFILITLLLVLSVLPIQILILV